MRMGRPGRTDSWEVGQQASDHARSPEVRIDSRTFFEAFKYYNDGSSDGYSDDSILPELQSGSL